MSSMRSRMQKWLSVIGSTVPGAELLSPSDSVDEIPLCDVGKGRVVIILGAGPAGALAANFLGRRGYTVELIERRPDPRRVDLELNHGSRAVGLAMVQRTVRTLRRAGLSLEEILACGVEATALRYFFTGGSKIKALEDGMSFLTVDRDALVKLLLDSAGRYDVRMHFNTRCDDIDFEKKSIFVESTKEEDAGKKRELTGEVIVCADGARSIGRHLMQQRLRRFSYSQSYYRHGYKTLMYTDASKRGFDPGQVLFWSGEGGRFVANGSMIPGDRMNITLCLPYDGPESLTMSDEASIRQFFETHLPDLHARHDSVVEEFLNNPTSDFVSVNCSQFHHSNAAVLIGDAAHAVVPFLGQGMNLALEDVHALDTLLAQYGDDWSRVLPAYTTSRKPEADAVREMSLNNYQLLDGSNLPFLLRREFTACMHKLLPSRYPMDFEFIMAFTNIPYSEVYRIQQLYNNCWYRLGRL